MYQFLPITPLPRLRELYRQENLELIKAIIALKLYHLYERTIPVNRAEAGTPDSFGGFLGLVPRAVKEQAFVHNFVPRERIDTYYSLTAEYIEALRTRIERNEWLAPETKQKASEKLDHLVVADLLYPYGEMDCEPLRTALRSCGSLTEAVACCEKFEKQCLLTFVGREPRRGNRYLSSEGTLKSEGNYQPAINVFYIGAAALIDGACDFTSRETILGSIGSHIGHELSHGYDTNGAQQDAEGTGPLFTEEDGRNFMARAASIAAKMSRIEALDGDICKYDVHPVPFARVNYGVAQFDEFYQAYPTVTEGTPMYIAPEDRELIW